MMNTPHQDFQKAKEELIDLLKLLEAVLAFQEAEESIGQIPQISDLAGQMKAYKQEADLFQKIEKHPSISVFMEYQHTINTTLDDVVYTCIGLLTRLPGHFFANLTTN